MDYIRSLVWNISLRLSERTRLMIHMDHDSVKTIIRSTASLGRLTWLCSRLFLFEFDDAYRAGVQTYASDALFRSCTSSNYKALKNDNLNRLSKVAHDNGDSCTYLPFIQTVNDVTLQHALSNVLLISASIDICPCTTMQRASSPYHHHKGTFSRAITSR